MSSNVNDYPPGAVAVATVDGKEQRVFRHPNGWFDSDGFIWLDPISGRIEDVRPLVVLDLANAAHAVDALRATMPLDKGDRDAQDMLVEQIADQIEAQTKPPRIPEPGLWGVVEAETNFPTRRWVHHEEGRWISDMGTVLHWEDLRNPVLIREGVES